MTNRCGKKRYSSQKEANKARKRSMKIQSGLQLMVYRCEDCHGYHLTKHLHRIGRWDPIPSSPRPLAASRGGPAGPGCPQEAVQWV